MGSSKAKKKPPPTLTPSPQRPSCKPAPSSPDSDIGYSYLLNNLDLVFLTAEVDVKIAMVLPNLEPEWPSVLSACISHSDALLQQCLAKGDDVNVELQGWNAATLSCVIGMPLDALLHRFQLLKEAGFTHFDRLAISTKAEGMVVVCPTSTCFHLYVQHLLTHPSTVSSCNLPIDPTLLSAPIHPATFHRTIHSAPFDIPGLLAAVLRAIGKFRRSRSEPPFSHIPAFFCCFCADPTIPTHHLVACLPLILKVWSLDPNHPLPDPLPPPSAPTAKLYHTQHMATAAALRPPMFQTLIDEHGLAPATCTTTAAGTPLLHALVQMYHLSPAALAQSVTAALHAGANPAQPDPAATNPLLRLPIAEAAWRSHRDLVRMLAEHTPAGVPPEVPVACLLNLLEYRPHALVDVALRVVQRRALDGGSLRLLHCMRYNAGGVLDVLALAELLGLTANPQIHLHLLVLLDVAVKLQGHQAPDGFRPPQHTHINPKRIQDLFCKVFFEHALNPVVLAMAAISPQVASAVVHHSGQPAKETAKVVLNLLALLLDEGPHKVEAYSPHWQAVCRQVNALGAQGGPPLVNPQMFSLPRVLLGCINLLGAVLVRGRSSEATLYEDLCSTLGTGGVAELLLQAHKMLGDPPPSRGHPIALLQEIRQRGNIFAKVVITYHLLGDQDLHAMACLMRLLAAMTPSPPIRTAAALDRHLRQGPAPVRSAACWQLLQSWLGLLDTRFMLDLEAASCQPQLRHVLLDTVRALLDCPVWDPLCTFLHGWGLLPQPGLEDAEEHGEAAREVLRLYAEQGGAYGEPYPGAMRVLSLAHMVFATLAGAVERHVKRERLQEDEDLASHLE